MLCVENISKKKKEIRCDFVEKKKIGLIIKQGY